MLSQPSYRQSIGGRSVLTRPSILTARRGALLPRGPGHGSVGPRRGNARRPGRRGRERHTQVERPPAGEGEADRARHSTTVRGDESGDAPRRIEQKTAQGRGEVDPSPSAVSLACVLTPLAAKDAEDSQW